MLPSSIFAQWNQIGTFDPNPSGYMPTDIDGSHVTFGNEGIVTQYNNGVYTTIIDVSPEVISSTGLGIDLFVQTASSAHVQCYALDGTLLNATLPGRAGAIGLSAGETNAYKLNDGNSAPSYQSQNEQLICSTVGLADAGRTALTRVPGDFFLVVDVDRVVISQFGVTNCTEALVINGFTNPHSLVLDEFGRLFVSEANASGSVRVFQLTGTGQSLAATEGAAITGLNTPSSITWDETASELYVITSGGVIERWQQAALPVELTEFTAKANKVAVDLMASEIDNDFFVIERSSDARRFEAIGKVEGSGSTASISNYSFIDKNPLKGNNYYRLKQTDFDGAYEYSDIRNVNFDGEELQIYPNPSFAGNEITIQGELNSPIRIYNSIGQVTAILQAGEVNKLLNLPAGIYFLNNRKIIVQ